MNWEIPQNRIFLHDFRQTWLSPPACQAFTMSSKADLTQANLNVELARKALKEFWDKALDEDGNFDWVFGDPSSTLCTFEWAGYTIGSVFNLLAAV